MLFSMTDAYLDALERASEEYKKGLAERKALDERLLHLRQTISTLMRLIGPGIPGHVVNRGITDAVRSYLQWVKTNTPDRRVTIRDIRERLEAVGYDFSSYKNPNASISGTLERLVTGGTVKKNRRRQDDGITITAYYWAGEVDPNEVWPPEGSEEEPEGEK